MGRECLWAESVPEPLQLHIWWSEIFERELKTVCIIVTAYLGHNIVNIHVEWMEDFYVLSNNISVILGQF